jgi:hypothetical protein
MKPVSSIPNSEGLSRSEAYDLAKQMRDEPPVDVVRKLFYALDIEGRCEWRKIVDYITSHPRPAD